ncbi:MAG: NADH:ubiquinone reductase (Na(+)-transporting) subunit F [Gammaproteobacteria bacterium]|nr:NADH:ubiquinone reductase (Na(+)-transporting) subunit F [Gammaproteobacteria bacterium]
MIIIHQNQISWAAKLRNLHRPLAFLAIIPLFVWLLSGCMLALDPSSELARQIHLVDIGAAQPYLSYLALSLIFAVSAIGGWLFCYSFDVNDQRQPAMPSLRAWHKWLGGLVGIQLIIWTLSAFALSLPDGVNDQSNSIANMFHLMSYSQNALLNNVLLLSASSLTLVFLVIALLMLLVILFTKRVASYQVSIYGAQGTENITVTGAQPLLSALAQQAYNLPSGCGGSGTCCQCKVKAVRVDSPLTAQERTTLTANELSQGYRLACQIAVDNDLAIEISNQHQQSIEVDVVSSKFVTPFIKELVVNVPYSANFAFDAGQFVNVQVPPFSRSMSQLNVPPQFQPHWLKQGLKRYQVVNSQQIQRSYSMASSSANGTKLVFNIGLAMPKRGYGPGVASTYLFGLSVGERLTISGPLGEFVSNDNSRREMIFVGAGSGMAPLKSHIDSVTVSQPSRKVSLWFGARTEDDIFYQAHFDYLARRHHNFNWTVALSKPDSKWQGATGHIQQTLFNQYLDQHPRLSDCDFFLCGPPVMMQDTARLLQRKGVSQSQILCDEFT